MTDAPQYTTPGVYITEMPAFPPSIVGVATAVPLFIGYTEFAGLNGKPLYNQPVAITSLADFEAYFGGPPPLRYALAPAPSQSATIVAPYNSAPPTVTTTGYFDLVSQLDMPFNLYRQMQLFFANGGGNCFVVSAGSYWANQSPVAAADSSGWIPGTIAASQLLAALTAAGSQSGPTMLVIPEACQLDDAGYASVACAMLAQAGSLQDRMAILDPPGCLTASDWIALEASQTALTTAIAPQESNFGYGAVYAPALVTSLVSGTDLLCANLASADNSLINNLLTSQATTMYQGAPLDTLQQAIAAAFPMGAGANDAQYSRDAAGNTQTPAQLSTLLQNALPLLAQIERMIAADLNLAPPSAALAGIWTQNDGNRGVWNAPANMALEQVEAPLYLFTDDEQGQFNVPLNGEAIDVIRSFPGRGNVVWGARTLDGNSNDYRYIQVRRTLIYIEQSIKQALDQFVFAANDSQTWTTVTGMIGNFLTQLWSQGGLMGDKASDAFTVQCGLGSTMTGQDVLDGYMVVQVTLQMIRPAEFIVLTFKQQMQVHE